MTPLHSSLLAVTALLLLGGAVAAIPESAAYSERSQWMEEVATSGTRESDVTGVPVATPSRDVLPTPEPTEPARPPRATRTPSPQTARSSLTDTTALDPDSGPSPTPTNVATPARVVVPVAIYVSAIDLDAPVVLVGVTPEGALDVPPDYESVGWYRDGAIPGQPGRAVLDGHVDSRTGPAVFFRLSELAPGDDIVIHLNDGSEQRFLVRESILIWTAEAPLDRIFGPSDRAELILITCGGPFDRDAGGYLQRRVIFAEVAQP